MARFKRRPQGGYWDFAQKRVVSRAFVGLEMARVSRGVLGTRTYRKTVPFPVPPDVFPPPVVDTIQEAIDEGAEEVSGEGRSGDT